MLQKNNVMAITPFTEFLKISRIMLTYSFQQDVKRESKLVEVVTIIIIFNSKIIAKSKFTSLLFPRP
jgi:hypothetical protein